MRLIAVAAIAASAVAIAAVLIHEPAAPGDAPAVSVVTGRAAPSMPMPSPVGTRAAAVATAPPAPPAAIAAEPIEMPMPVDPSVEPRVSADDTEIAVRGALINPLDPAGTGESTRAVVSGERLLEP